MSGELNSHTGVRGAIFRLLMAVAFATPFLCSMPVGFADQALDDYKFAVGLYKQQRWELSVTSFRNFLRDHGGHPRTAYAKLYLGLSLVNAREFDQARTVLRDFIEQYPDNNNVPHAFYRIAESSYLLDDLKTAEADLQSFIDRYPDDPLLERAFPYLGDVQLRLGKAGNAAASFNKAIEKFPEGVLAEDARFGLARSLETDQRVEDAIREYETLAANSDGTRAAEAQMTLAAISFQADQFDQAASQYDDMAQRFPTSPQVPRANLNAGYAYYNGGQMREAAERFDRAAQEPTLLGTASFWQGLSLKSLGENDRAIAAFKAAYEADKNQVDADRVLYEWAQILRRGDRPEEAIPRFLELLERWPDSELADDGLHAAALAAFEAGDLDQTESLLDQFDERFAQGGLRMHHLLLRGRVLHQQGQEQQAATTFRHVINESTIPETRDRGRFYLAVTLQALGDHAGAIEVSEPLVEQIAKEGASSEFVDVLLVQAKSYQETKQHELTRKRTSDYLEIKPGGESAAEALSMLTTAFASDGKKTEAQARLSELVQRFPESPFLLRTAYSVAEMAYDMQDWPWSEATYGSIVDLGAQSPYFIPSVSGLAWSQYKNGKPTESAVNFGKVVTADPEHELAPEAAFMKAQSLEEAKQWEQAAAEYQTAYTKYDQSQFAHPARLQEARILGRIGNMEQADAAYEVLLEKFPDQQNRDKLLDEWAVLHYEAGQYVRSDALFKRLIVEAPDSDRADNARLILAESDLIAGRKEDAEKALRELEGNPKSDPEVQQVALHHLLKVYSEREAWKQLADSSAEFGERFPESTYRWYARFQLAEAQFQLGDLDAATKILDELLAKQDDPAVSQEDWFPRVYVLLAEAAMQRKQYADVAKLVEQFRNRDPDSPLLYQAEEILGRSYKNQAMFERARETFQHVIEDPRGQNTVTAAKCQLMIAETYLIQKDYSQALIAYLRVHSQYPFPEYQAPALYQAAQCDEALRNWDQAAKTYQMVVDQFPDSEFAEKAQKRRESALQRASN